MNKQIEKHFCNFEQSADLKSLGFSEDCIAHFTEVNGEVIIVLPCAIADWNDVPPDNTSAPLKSQAIDFFAEKFGLFGTTFYLHDEHSQVEWFEYEIVFMKNWQGQRTRSTLNSIAYDSRHEAESSLIDRLIELAQAKDR